MLDERWDADDADLAAGLRAILDAECTSEVVRAAERAPDGRAPELEARLHDFGLDDLPADPATLTAAAWELGRALSPVAFVETAAVAAVTRRRDVADGCDGLVPATAGSALVGDAAGGGHIVAVTAPARRTTAGDLLCEAPEPPRGDAEIPADDVDRIRRLGALLDAARMVGASEGLLSIGVDYVGERCQFGQPVGSFQAVAHRLADALVAVDGAGLLVRKAAWVARPHQAGDGAPDALFASIARERAVHAARKVATDVHQVMGGYGFADEYDCQLYSRRLRSWAMRRGDVAAALAEVGRSVVDPGRRGAVTHLWNSDRGLSLPRWAAEMDGAP